MVNAVTIVDVSDVEVTAEAGVFAVTVDTGSKFVIVQVYFDLESNTARIHTLNLSPLVIEALVSDGSLKADFAEAVRAERDSRLEAAEQSKLTQQRVAAVSEQLRSWRLN